MAKKAFYVCPETEVIEIGGLQDWLVNYTGNLQDPEYNDDESIGWGN